MKGSWARPVVCCAAGRLLHHENVIVVLFCVFWRLIWGWGKYCSRGGRGRIIPVDHYVAPSMLSGSFTGISMVLAGCYFLSFFPFDLHRSVAMWCSSVGLPSRNDLCTSSPFILENYNNFILLFGQWADWFMFLNHQCHKLLNLCRFLRAELRKQYTTALYIVGQFLLQGFSFQDRVYIYFQLEELKLFWIPGESGVTKK